MCPATHGLTFIYIYNIDLYTVGRRSAKTMRVQRYNFFSFCEKKSLSAVAGRRNGIISISTYFSDVDIRRRSVGAMCFVSVVCAMRMRRFSVNAHITPYQRLYDAYLFLAIMGWQLYRNRSIFWGTGSGWHPLRLRRGVARRATMERGRRKQARMGAKKREAPLGLLLCARNRT